MTSLIRTSVLIIVICLGMVFAGCSENKQTKIQKKNVQQQKVVHQTVTFDVLPDIKKAQLLLDNEDAGYFCKTVNYSNGKKGKAARKWCSTTLDDFNVLLAVENVNTRKIEIIKLTHKGTQAPSGFSVLGGKKNGVNTAFDVRYPSGYIVLALKRVVGKDGGFEEVVYTPYTPEIDTKTMRDIGLQYLKDNLDGADSDLRSKGVRSRAFGGLVADAVPKKVALTLSLIEHIDPSRFESGQPIEQLVNEVLVITAANKQRAYAYSVSKAGARGLFQFIPRTYHSLIRLYASAGLDTNFVRGMEEHQNAAKASLLLFDSDLGYLPRNHRQFLKKHPEAMGKYLAAAYNGGASRAARAINIYRGDWERHVLSETQCYLRKFNAVWKLLYPTG
jgi:hypothetical protein